ncbi:tRNA lysidine(34) synthetase TilS [Neogemmobacter tilapiae]|uniref:tRNA(Ile)-lysidine synthase n=1 Tax=Neogemmobacter tilapiae TaxID=875041 RepID=A0A918TJ30_9RHOB|nr:tRNA lysidine(34) synthetase TilS [Gemmobacter tilapiae]GHC48013.1 tRNA(Ile)-lysidine synthase [Gemmobacter tilapiae]
MTKAGLLALMGQALHDFDGPLGVAVSGGGDSLAALSLAAASAPQRLQAATVDHRLRAESAAEAARVGEICAQLSIPHQVLVWHHQTVTGNLQDQARQARYDLLAEWAQGRGLQAVLLGHTAEDQAECLLMGLARAAGLDGLAGMRPRFQHNSVTFLRPLLTARRADLRQYLTGQGLAWIDDPSNDDDRFTRVRFRKAMAALAPLGLTVETLAASAQHLAQARQAMDQSLQQAFRKIGREQAGALFLDHAGLAKLPPELQRRMIAAALRWISGTPHGPRGPALARALQSVLAGRDATLHGARLRPRRDQIQITRESKAIAHHQTPTGQLWDHRWHLTGPHAPDLHLAALGADGLRLCPEWRDLGLAREVLIVLPAVWRGDELVAAPLVRTETDWQASCRSFDLFILSH